MRELVTLGRLALHDDSDPGWHHAVQHRQLLLIALVARAPNGLSRDVAMATLWPERDEPSARHLLEQGLYVIRRALGRDVISDGATLRLADSAFACDANAFEAAIANQAFERANALYHAPFLEGVRTGRSVTLERWVDTQRRHLAGLALGAVRTLARRAHAADSADDELRWWRRAAALDPYDVGSAFGLIECLARADDLPGVMRHAELYEKLLRTDLDVGLPQEIVGFLAELRARRSLTSAVGTPSAPSSADSTLVQGSSGPLSTHSQESAGTAPQPSDSSHFEPSIASRGRRTTTPRLLPPARSVATLAAAAALVLSVGAMLAARGRRVELAPRLVEAGIAAYQQGDASAAHLMLRAAVDQDSTLALAWYYMGRIEPALARDSGMVFLQRARAAAPSAPLRDRSLVEAGVAIAFDDPARVEAARRFQDRFPNDAAAAHLLGLSLTWSGDVLSAIPYLRRAIVLDSATVDRGALRCDGCEAYGALTDAYALCDSLEAASRIAGEWVRRQPHSPIAWQRAAGLFALRGFLDSALAAMHVALARPAGYDRARAFLDSSEEMELYLIAEQFADAARVSARTMRGGTLDSRLGVEWFQTILLRTTGRPTEALALARRMRASKHVPDCGMHYCYAELEAQTLQEMGNHRAAAALFDSAAVRSVGPHISASAAARKEAWLRTNAATSLAAAGDTAKLESRAEMIQRLGQRSGYARDRRLHFFVRGLLRNARGDRNGAVEEFRAAVYAPTGFPRASYELGRTLLALNRPLDAIAALRPTLHTGVQASALYITRPEIHEALGEAFHAAGVADSARQHFMAVVRAWRDGEERFRVRAERAQHAIDALALVASAAYDGRSRAHRDYR